LPPSCPKISTMKNKLNIAIVGTVLASGILSAATTTDTFTAGEILLGFYASSGTGASKNLVANLGSFGNFDNNDGATVSILGSSLVSDLVATYGANWNSRTDITWSVTGANFAQSVAGLTRNTIFATSPRASVTDAPISITGGSDGTLAGIRLNVNSINTAYDAATTTANSTVTVVIDGSNSDSMQARMVLSASPQFGTDNTNSAASVTISDFYGLVPTSGGIAPNGAAVDTDGVVFTRGTNYLGYFTLSSNGLNYTASGTAIPEPSSYAVLGGLVALGYSAIRRRRNTKA